ncbi:MAG TPA: carbon monoxide dehydrogenase subunit G [Anaerolineales bacterium]
MQFDGTVNIEAPREKVWEFLTDPNLVSQCAPGLKSVEVIEPDKKFRAVAGVGFGSVKVTFETDVEWVEVDAPNYAKMKAHGKAPGSGVDINSTMKLSDGPDGATEMQWSADIVVVGTIASMASRLMGSVTRRLTADFFNCVKDKIEA